MHFPPVIAGVAPSPVNDPTSAPAPKALFAAKMRYYHLSPDAGLTRIRASCTSRDAATILPRIPEDCAGEDETIPRVCVAPAVCLCLLAGPRKGVLYIYRIDAAPGVVPVSAPVGYCADFKHTGEQWITDKDIAASGGEVKLIYQGFVKYTHEMEWALRERIGCPIQSDAASDDSLWEIRGDEWLLGLSTRT